MISTGNVETFLSNFEKKIRVVLAAAAVFNKNTIIGPALISQTWKNQNFTSNLTNNSVMRGNNDSEMVPLEDEVSGTMMPNNYK